MEKLEIIMLMLDDALGTRRKRHIAGGILISVSLLFGGVALTVLTLKAEDQDEQDAY